MFWDRLALISLTELHAVRRWLDGEFERRLASLDDLEARKTALDRQGAAERSLRGQQVLARQVSDLDRQAALEARLLQLVGKQQQLLDRLIWIRESVDRWEALHAVAPAAVELDWEDLVGAAEQAAGAEDHLDELLRILGVPEGEWPHAEGMFFGADAAASQGLDADGLLLVAEVLDGRTLRLATGERVRYIGVDAPLLEGPLNRPDPGAHEAWQANRRLVAGRHVRLEEDAGDRDASGALWRYVWVGDSCANAELIRQGVAYHQPLSPNYRHSEWFAQMERQARRKRRGVWR
jgi:endonuclease YncB( thermonuclease family)